MGDNSAERHCWDLEPIEDTLTDEPDKDGGDSRSGAVHVAVAFATANIFSFWRTPCNATWTSPKILGFEVLFSRREAGFWPVRLTPPFSSRELEATLLRL